MANKLLVAVLVLTALTACNTANKKTNDMTPDKALKNAIDPKAPTNPIRKPASGDPATSQVIDPAFLRSQADYHFSLAEAYALDGDAQKAIDEYKLTLV